MAALASCNLRYYWKRMNDTCPIFTSGKHSGVVLAHTFPPSINQADTDNAFEVSRDEASWLKPGDAHLQNSRQQTVEDLNLLHLVFKLWQQRIGFRSHSDGSSAPDVSPQDPSLHIEVPVGHCPLNDRYPLGSSASPKLSPSSLLLSLPAGKRLMHNDSSSPQKHSPASKKRQKTKPICRTV